MKKNTKRYIMSSIITFFTGVFIVILAQINDLTLESIKNGAYLGILFTALRAGIKALLEYLLVSFGEN